MLDGGKPLLYKFSCKGGNPHNTNQMRYKMTKQVYKAPEGYSDLTVGQQVANIAAWCVANKQAVIKPIEAKVAVGNLPAYIRKPSGKRATINHMLTSKAQGIKVADFLVEAAKLGGGYVELAAALAGGYSRSSKVYGNPVVTVEAQG